MGPVLRVHHKFDIMMNTENCKKVHEFLIDGLYDKDLLQQMTLTRVIVLILNVEVKRYSQ